jgi:hypothetical protein
MTEEVERVSFRDRILQHRIPLDVSQIVEHGTPCELVLEKNRFVCQVPRGESPILCEVHFRYRGYRLFLSLADNFPFTQPYMMIFPLREDEVLREIQQTTLQEVAEDICGYLEPTTDDLRKSMVCIKEFVDKNVDRTRVSEEEILTYFRDSCVHSPAMRLHTMVSVMKRGVDMIL